MLTKKNYKKSIKLNRILLVYIYALNLFWNTYFCMLYFCIEKKNVVVVVVIFSVECRLI